jgi:D-lactate dehydrogenase (cytochrome)
MSYMDEFVRTHDDPGYYFVQAGVTVERLNQAAAGYGRFFPGIPVGASRDATLGGVISTNVSGMYAMKYGTAGDSVARVDVLLADGTYVELGPHAIETTSGVNLAPLIIGAKGSMGIILGAAGSGPAQEQNDGVGRGSFVQMESRRRGRVLARRL